MEQKQRSLVATLFFVHYIEKKIQKKEYMKYVMSAELKPSGELNTT